jgi:RNA polymerase sigma-70 factor (ECF subfamily)
MIHFLNTGFWLSMGILTGFPVLLAIMAPVDTGDGNGQPELKEDFESSIHPYMDLLYNMALRFTRNPDDAADLVQETILRAYRFYYQFQKGTNLRAWLLKILRNTFINQYRKRASEPKKVGYEEIEPYFERVAKNNSSEMLRAVHEDVFGKMLGDEVVEALEKIPEEFRTAVILCDLEELSYQEIAEIMGCPTGTVRSRISRGRKMLQSQLLDYARQEGYIKVNED